MVCGAKFFVKFMSKINNKKVALLILWGMNKGLPGPTAKMFTSIGEYNFHGDLDITSLHENYQNQIGLYMVQVWSIHEKYQNMAISVLITSSVLTVYRSSKK